MHKQQIIRIFSFFVILTMLLSVVGSTGTPVKAAVETITYLGSLGAAMSKTSGTSLVVNTTAPVTTGDDIIITYATDPNSSLVISVADPAGNTYSQVGYVVNSGQLRTYVYAAYNVNSMPTGSSITITASPAVTARAAVVALFRGLADSSPLDQTHTGYGSGAAPSSGATSTTTQADELLIGAIGTEGPDDDTVGTWDSSFLAGPRLGTTGGTADTNITAELGYRIVSAAGAYTASKSGITSRDWAAMVATFTAGSDDAHPAIFTTGTPLSAFSSLPGSLSAEQTYTVSGSGLTDAITITAPADFQISLSSGSGFSSSLVLSPSGGSLAATTLFVRFNRATEGSSSGNLAHTSSGATTRNIAVSGTSAPLSPVSFNILLGRPENASVTANIIPDQNVDFYIEYGTSSGAYTSQTATYTATANQPIEFVIEGLSANTRYYYHIVYHRTGVTDWNNAAEHSFITQRPPGSSFTFTVTSDSHLGQYGGQTADETALYTQTLQNVAADHPDFHIDTGDTFAMDPSPLGTGMTVAEADAAYLIERPYLGKFTDSIPYFLALGNHENEEGWNFDDVFTAPDQSLALVGMLARKKYFPNPVPDSFYTGNTDPLATPIGGDTNQEDYYAWTWGDALFVVIDPYHYSMVWPSEGDTYGGEGQDGEVSGTRWDWSLGIQQYLWLKSTLENSPATYKFVFTHQVTGGSTVYGRGGIGAAPYFEWGGKNADGTWGFDVHRPASAGWTLPVHQLMVANGVNIFFHGHDHIYSYEQLDGITYVECAKPDDAGYAWDPYGYGYNEDLYPNGISIQNSGHLRVSVSPAETKVEYVRSYLPGDGVNGTVAHSFTVTGNAPTTYALTVTSAGAGAGTVTSSPGGITCGATCSANFNYNTAVTLTATPETGSVFAGWSGGGCSGTGDCHVTMNAATTVTATFDVIPPTCYDLTFSHTGQGSDPVASPLKSSACSTDGQYVAGETISLSAVPTTGWFINGWTGTDDDDSTASPNTLSMPAGNHSVTVIYSTTALTYSLPLQVGWNLVSFNLHPLSTLTPDVLSSISSKYDLVYAWDAASGLWLKYDPHASPYASDLKDLDERMGFWIKMNSAATLVVSGTAPGTSTIDLQTGWNLVSFPATGNLALPDALRDHGMGVDFSLVYAYHAADSGDPWKLYNREAQAWANDLTSLTAGWGYWIKVSSAHTWDISY